MSNQFFPTLHTSSWKMSRTPQWETTVKTGVSGDRKRAPLQERPRWRWKLQNGILQTATGDLQAIQNLYTAMYGRLDYFLWQDPEGESIADPTAQINFLGNYYWPVAFTEDAMDFDRFAYQLWECGTCEFEQVLLSEAAHAAAQSPNGLPTTAVLSYVTTHIQGTGYTGIATVSLGSGFTLFDSSAYAGRTDATSWNNGSHEWTASVGPLVSSSTPDAITVSFSISGSLFGNASPADKLYVYDVFMDVTYQNGVIVTFRPTTATVVASGTGTIINAANAVDGDPATFAEIDRTHFSGLSDSPVLKVSGFSS